MNRRQWLYGAGLIAGAGHLGVGGAAADTREQISKDKGEEKRHERTSNSR